MIIDLINKSIEERVISAEFRTVINCSKEKGDTLEEGNFRGLKLRNQVLKAFLRLGAVRKYHQVLELLVSF